MLNQRVSAIDTWLTDLWWLAALLAFLLLLAIVLLVLSALRRTRHASRTSQTEAERAAEVAEELRQKDLEIARINEDLAIARHDAEHAAQARTEHHPASILEEAELVAAGAVAGSAVARSHTASADDHQAAETAADLHARLHQRDQELDRIKEELVRLRLDLQQQRDSAIRTAAQPARPRAETVLVAETVETVAAGAVAGAALAEAGHGVHRHAPADNPPAHTASKPPVHSVIDEADWSITHYRVVIGEARARKHDRPQALAEVIRLSELMLAHYPDNAEAVSFARVNKADALAESGDLASALLECETVIAHYGAATAPAVRTQLAHAHFVKAAIHARHRDVAHCTAELDQWAKVHGVFDQRLVTEDVRFKDIVTITEFQVYIANKSR